MLKTKRILLSLIALFAVFAFIGCSNATSPSTPVVDPTAPTVLSNTPLNQVASVAVKATISATFSEAMDASTITAASFVVLKGTVSVPGTVTYDSTSLTAKFVPTTILDANTLYTATLTISVTDAGGNNMDAAHAWTFTTAAVADITAPTVLSTTPTNQATGIGLKTTIYAKFSEAMDSATITTSSFTVLKGTVSVPGTVSYDVPSQTASFVPTAAMDTSTLYTATVTTSVADAAHNTLAAAYAWTFTTAAAADTTAPTVASTSPIHQATGVSINSVISAKFSEAMNHATIVAANFTVQKGTTSVPGTVTYDIPNTTAKFAPTVALDANALYTATVTTSVADIEGNALAANKVWTFTTAAAGIGPAPVLLGSAGNFVILAKTAISTVPASAITGDIGVSPAAETFLTGFSQTKFTGYSTAPQVTGFMYAADMTPPTPTKMTTAISDMETAYTDAAGRSTPDYLNMGAGEIGGQTLTPGLYKWGTSVTISTDAVISGAANDVWIFQIDGDLSLANGKIITLSGGAQAKNIFWQVAGATSLGTTAQFKGVILCKTAITVKTGASMNGKALAQTQVALDQATVTDVE